MATDMNRLQGEVFENPKVPSLQGEQDGSVERMVIGFLRAMLEEQRPKPVQPASSIPDPAAPDQAKEIPSYLQKRVANGRAPAITLNKESM